MAKFKKFLKWAVIFIVAVYLVLVAVRVFMLFGEDRTKAEVEKIHNIKLTLDDVLGRNLPPEPTAEEAMATIAGVDVNQNGIRDDVELAIFKEYPDSTKTRAVLLQYALALQMEMTQKIVNTETVTEAITELSRADTCLADQIVPRKSLETSRSYSDIEKIDSYIKFVEGLQFDTEYRLTARGNFYEKLGSFGESTNKVCDVDSSLLPN